MELKIGIRDMATVFCMLALFIAGTGMLAEAESAVSIEADLSYISNNSTPVLATNILPLADNPEDVTAHGGKASLPAYNGTVSADVPASSGGSNSHMITSLPQDTRNTGITSLVTWFSSINGDNTGELTRIILEMLTHVIRNRYTGLNPDLHMAMPESNESTSPAIMLELGDIASTI